jgi:hypothetical protein
MAVDHPDIVEDLLKLRQVIHDLVRDIRNKNIKRALHWEAHHSGLQPRHEEIVDYVYEDVDFRHLKIIAVICQSCMDL